MGVMVCSRNGCEEIMCQTYINDVGYICGSCKYEFEGYLISKGTTEMPRVDMLRELRGFMSHRKSVRSYGGLITVHDLWN